MKRPLPSLLTAVLVTVCLASPARACFDTYGFLQKQGLAYPKGLLALETSGEYVARDLGEPGGDAFAGAASVYYGLGERFSVQGSLASAEKSREEFRVDQWGLRGVCGLVRADGDGYCLDAVLEVSASTADGSSAYELSAPNIWYRDHLTVVFHPVAALASDGEFGMRGHGGLFYSVGGLAIVGLGSEYESAQSSAQFGRRLVRGAGATSLFVGAGIGSNLFLQNEVIKGWGVDGPDLGFALTLKYLMPRAGSR